MFEYAWTRNVARPSHLDLDRVRHVHVRRHALSDVAENAPLQATRPYVDRARGRDRATPQDPIAIERDRNVTRLNPSRDRDLDLVRRLSRSQSRNRSHDRVRDRQLARPRLVRGRDRRLDPSRGRGRSQSRPLLSRPDRMLVLVVVTRRRMRAPLLMVMRINNQIKLNKI